MSELGASAHDPGGKVRLPLQFGVRGAAEFSPCGRYRHWLSRYWGKLVDNQLENYALWIGMNPSTAEADVDDPTIRKEMHFTRTMGLSGYIKCNVLDFRATNPKDLLAPGIAPCSKENFAVIKTAANSASVIIAAWGVMHKSLRSFVASVELMLSDREILCIGITKDGFPRHPLYLRNDAVPLPFRGRNHAI